MRKYMRVLLVLALVLVLTVSAAALDLSETGSLSMTIADGEVRGSGLQIVAYRIAKGEIRNNNLVFVSLVEGDYDFNDLSADEVTALAGTDVTGLDSYTGKTDAEGKVTIGSLPIGMYLVKLIDGGNFSMTSFVAPVPVGGSSGWDFTVEAKPKVEYDEPYVPPYDPPEEPTEEIPDEEVPKDQPEEELEEIEDEDVPLAELPDTGLLQWPIAVLIAGGILLFTIGMVVDRRARKN